MAAKTTGNATKSTAKLESTASTTFTMIPFGEIKVLPRLYRHRTEAELNADLKQLVESLTTEGQLTPIEYYVDGKGIKTLICGHRRIQAMQVLIDRNEPGWTLDTPVKAQLVTGSPEDFVVRSIADNVVRQSLSDLGILAAVKAAIDAKASHTRIAAALGIPLTTFQRYAALARNERMKAHVEDSHVGFSDAVKLLTEAEKSNRVDQFLAEFDTIVTITKGKIETKNLQRKEKTGKDLPDADRKVKKELQPHVIRDWLSRLKDGKPIRTVESATWTYPARIDKNVLTIPGVSLDLAEADYDRIAKVATRLYRVTQDLKPILKKRELEAGSSTDEGAGQAELDYLKSAGLDSAADLEREIEARNRARAAEVKDPEYSVVKARAGAPSPTEVEVHGVDQEEAEDEDVTGDQDSARDEEARD